MQIGVEKWIDSRAFYPLKAHIAGSGTDCGLSNERLCVYVSVCTQNSIYLLLGRIEQSLRKKGNEWETIGKCFLSLALHNPLFTGNTPLKLAQGNKKVLYNFSKLNLHAGFVRGRIFIVESKFNSKRRRNVAKYFQTNQSFVCSSAHALLHIHTPALSSVCETIAQSATNMKWIWVWILLVSLCRFDVNEWIK